MRKLLFVILFFLSAFLFSQDRNISGILSASYSNYPILSAGTLDLSNHAFSFSVGLRLWKNFSLLAGLTGLFQNEVREVEDSFLGDFGKYSLQLGFGNAMIKYRKHNNVYGIYGDITNIELMYNFAGLGDIEDYVDIYAGIIYQRYDTYFFNYDGYGVSVYTGIDPIYTARDLLKLRYSDYAIDFDNFTAFAWGKFGLSYVLGPARGPGTERENYPPISYLVALDCILGLNFIFHTFVPISLGIGYTFVFYMSDMFGGFELSEDFSRNQGIIFSFTIRL